MEKMYSGATEACDVFHGDPPKCIIFFNSIRTVKIIVRSNNLPTVRFDNVFDDIERRLTAILKWIHLYKKKKKSDDIINPLRSRFRFQFKIKVLSRNE